MNQRSNHWLKGSFVALVTPMKSNGDVDYPALSELVEWHIASGTHGIVVMGTTGEAPLVSDEEYLKVVKTVISLAKMRISVIVGCGGVSTDKTIGLAKQLNELKPDAYLCVTPYYVKPTQQGLIKHFQSLADCCDAPVLLYNVPSRTGVDLENEAVAELSQHSNIVGIKDATGEINRVKPLKALGKDFILFSGDDESAFEFVAAGGDGVISVTANVIPLLVRQWNQLMIESPDNLEGAQEIFERTQPWNKALFVEANPIVVKYALWKMGKIADGIRLPLVWASEKTQNIINKILHQN